MAYSVIKKPSDYFNTKLYTGNGGTLNVTGVGFQPDLVWQKSRSLAYNHNLYDVIRGANAHLRSNLTTAEASPSDGLTSFNSDGYTMVQGGAVEASNNGATYASWNFKANGTGVANTDGSISSTVSANTTSGFSIVSYTGTGANATVGHGLGTTPACIISKNRNDADNWNFWHQNLSATSGKYMTFNDTGAEQTDSTIWNTAPTSTVFGIGTNNRINGSSDNMIAYCFAEKQGFSKFSSYVGNSSTDGTFVYLGFKPAFVMIKATSGTEEWWTWDNKRDDDNVVKEALHPNSSAATETSDSLDFLSNGFKMRVNSGARNGSGTTYIYMAFAEEPLVGDNPATAR